MEGNKLDLLNKKEEEQPLASYKALPEADMEDHTVTKAVIKAKNYSDADGADEKMLPDNGNTINIADNKVIIQENNGDAKIDIHGLKSSFPVMTKEELMKYANDPFWIKIRWVLFCLFWLTWLGMLVGAVAIIYTAPKCDPPKPREWWEKGPLSEIKPDATLEHLEHLKADGFKGLIVEWIGSSYEEIKEDDHVIQLLKAGKDIDIPLILDLKAGVSDIWFNESENKSSQFSDYYIWKESDKVGVNGSKEPPNNWISKRNESSWKYSEIRKEFYYAPEGSPQLNFRNPAVVDEFSNVLKRFADRGARGFRIRDANVLLVDSNFHDEAVDNSKEAKQNPYVLTDYGFYVHSKTENLLELGPLLKTWRRVAKNVTGDGPFMVKNVLENIESFRSQPSGSVVVDLPSQSNLFNKPVFEAEKVAHALDHIFKTQRIEWPIWTHKSTSLPLDVLDSVTYLLPGVPLVEHGAEVNKELAVVRDTPSVMRGDFEYKTVANNTVLTFTRSTPGSPGVLVAVNPSNSTITVNFEKEIEKISSEVTISFLSKNFNVTEYVVGLKKDADNILLSGRSSIVLTYTLKKEDD